MSATVASRREWQYQARTGDGRKVKGTVEASTEAGAVDQIKGLGLVPVKVAAAGTGLNASINIPGLEPKIKLKDLAVASRQIATMVSAGMPLMRVLASVSAQTEHPKLRKILIDVTREVETGRSFSDGLEKFPRDIPPLMVHMVRAGEAGGFLDRALDSVATNYEKETKLQSEVKSAMTYPVMVLVMTAVAVGAMLIFIVPTFDKMFTDMGAELPVPTQILVSLGKAMPIVAPILIVVIVAFVIWYRRHKNDEKVRAFRDPLLLKLPVFGPLLQKIALTRFCRNFADMLRSGVPMLQALSIVGSTSGNWVIEGAAKRIGDGVRHGRQVSQPLQFEPVFPQMAVQMIAAGEESGAMETMLGKIADFYDAEVESTTASLTSIIEPLLIAFLGVVVGGMIIALYMPIFGIADAVTNSSG